MIDQPLKIVKGILYEQAEEVRFPTGAQQMIADEPGNSQS